MVHLGDHFNAAHFCCILKYSMSHVLQQGVNPFRNTVLFRKSGQQLYWWDIKCNATRDFLGRNKLWTQHRLTELKSCEVDAANVLGKVKHTQSNIHILSELYVPATPQIENQNKSSVLVTTRPMLCLNLDQCQASRMRWWKQWDWTQTV